MMSDTNMYICAHNNISTWHPSCDGYVIAAQHREINDKQLPVIYTDDEFTRLHNICYGELCQQRYMMNHPELLSDYIGFSHYRRYFRRFRNSLESVPDIIGKHGAVFSKTWSCGLPNKCCIAMYHSGIFIDPMRDAAYKACRGYGEAFDRFLELQDCSCLNMYIMGKEDFLENAGIVFSVLDSVDRHFGLCDNESTRAFMLEQYELGNWFKGNIEWQQRLQGFLGEYLWNVIKLYKFPNAKMYKVDIVADRDTEIKKFE